MALVEQNLASIGLVGVNCPGCNKTLDSGLYVNIGFAGINFSGYICKDCYDKLTLEDLMKYGKQKRG